MTKTSVQHSARPAYMAEYVTKVDLKQALHEFKTDLTADLTTDLTENLTNSLKESITKSITLSIMTEVSGLINKLLIHMDERFDALEHRQDNMAIRIDKLEGGLRQLNTKYDRLLEVL